MFRDAQIAVVGGGPAGSTCARLLARAGCPTTLFEAHPSDEKPCGGAVPGGTLKEFPELMDPSLRRRVITEVVIYSPSDSRVAIPVPEGIHIFKRRELDAHLRRLAEEAGAHVRVTRVTDVKQHLDGRWQIGTEEGSFGPFDYLVGADGVRGIVRRSVVSRYADEELTISVYAYAPVFSQGEMIIKFFGDFDGYLWIFPRTDHASIGIGALHRRVSTARLEEEIQRFVEKHYPEGRVGQDTLKGYLIPSSARPPSAGPAGRWALIGDAGGFVDPLTREGISHAMRSASDLVRRFLTRGEFATPPLPADLHWAHRYRVGFFRRDFLEKMVHLSTRSPAIRKVIADLFAGAQPYRSLKRRLILNALPCGFEMGLAIMKQIRPVWGRSERPGA